MNSTALAELTDLASEVPAVAELIAATSNTGAPTGAMWNNWGNFNMAATPRTVAAQQ